MFKHTRVFTTGLLAAGLLAGCNNTLSEMSIPENVVWNTMLTAVASPYPDLSVMTVGDDIAAEIGESATYAYCRYDDTGEYTLNTCTSGLCEQACPSATTFLGERTLYAVRVQLNRPDFEAGGVQLISDEAGTVQSMSFAISPTNSALQITAGVNEGTFPVDPNFPLMPELELYNQLLFLEMNPPEPTFGALDDLPYLVCGPESGPTGGDVIAINTVQIPPNNYDVTCGSLPISFNLTPQFDSVGECISESIKTQCKNAGLTGRARASCNAAQIGNCHASFFVPSNHAS